MAEHRPIEERFWEKVNKNGSIMPGMVTPCWEWQAYRQKWGYGIIGISHSKKTMLTHRYSYQLHYGEIPEGLLVLHKCDNPACVNPEHLWLGTDADNNADCLAKGRGNKATGDRNGARLHPEKVAKGEAVSLAKLTEADVKRIREKYFVNGLTQKQLAKEFSVNQTAISNIIRFKTWRHI